MIKVVIIDDEPKGREVLRSLLEEFFPETRVVALADCVEAGVKVIKAHGPDLVFLDIEMPMENGFKLFDYFQSIDFEVVFTTAYDVYALRAIKVSALDYILKPIMVADLQEAIRKFRHKHDKSMMPRIKLLENDMRNRSADIKQLALPTLEGYDIVETDDVLYLESDGSYTVFHLVNGEKLVVSRNLKEYDDLLSGTRFFRIHHSTIVNLKYVKRYTKGKTGSVMLSNGVSLDVAARRKEEFLKALRNQ